MNLINTAKGLWVTWSLCRTKYGMYSVFSHFLFGFHTECGEYFVNFVRFLSNITQIYIQCLVDVSVQTVIKYTHTAISCRIS